MKMSRAEAQLMETMKNMKGDRPTWTVEQLADVIYAEKVRPRNWRASTVMTMRTLTLKTSSRLVKVIRCSRLGRGAPAEYMLDTRQKEAFLLRRRVHK